MHVLWLSITSSRMRNDFQYSVQFSYNTFPLPNLNDDQKESITKATISIISIRELYSDKTLAELYDPVKMPIELLNAHQNLDTVVESLYNLAPFKSDEKRLESLFKLYDDMIKKEIGDQNA